jgi:hypothetical protein
MPDFQCFKLLSASIADSSPEKAEDIRLSFERLDTSLSAKPTDTTRTTRGSLIVNHEDGSRSHFCYRRPMTLDEIEEERNQPPPTPLTPIIYPDGIPDGYDNPFERPMQPTWRQLAEIIDCILAQRKNGSAGWRPFERKHPRMCGEHSFESGPDGNEVHLIKLIAATLEEEEWHLKSLPTMGLHREDLAAYYRAQRGPLERAIDHLIFWR